GLRGRRPPASRRVFRVSRYRAGQGPRERVPHPLGPDAHGVQERQSSVRSSGADSAACARGADRKAPYARGEAPRGNRPGRAWRSPALRYLEKIPARELVHSLQNLLRVRVLVREAAEIAAKKDPDPLFVADRGREERDVATVAEAGALDGAAPLAKGRGRLSRVAAKDDAHRRLPRFAREHQESAVARGADPGQGVSHELRERELPGKL